jgi:O-antigen/teichoic acid export membrane protein
MKLSRGTLVRGISWTVLAYALGQLFRFASNLVLTRLLAPELFGIIAIVNSVRLGVDLLTDVGIGQNMVYNKASDRPDFYNTAWTLQIIRGFCLWVAGSLAAVPISHFYNAPILAYVIPVASLPFLLGGFVSTGSYLALKRMQFVRTNVFELLLEMISSMVNILFAVISPTVWALLSGVIVAAVARMVGSYFIIPGIRHRLGISGQYARDILGYSKWIFVSSVVFFLSMNFDSLYLGKAGSLELLGVYGVARVLSQQLVALVARLSTAFVFPMVASSNEKTRDNLRREVKLHRAIFLLATATVLSFIAVVGDLLVAVLYDQRYQAAGWMLPILVMGAWFSILCTVNESILLGLGKPSYTAIANCVKFCWLLVGIPFAYQKFGTVGVVTVVAISDLWRYFPVLLGQVRERFSFAAQDLIITSCAIVLMGFWELVRWQFGFGITPI